MEIAENTVVTLSYHARKGDQEGELVDYSGQDYPLRFLIGAGKMLPYFEQQLIGKSNQEDFDFKLPAEYAYGQRDEHLIKNLPVTYFREQEGYTAETLVIGEYIRYENTEEAQSGKIISKDKLRVMVDFNHPLAGHDLFFKGHIIAVRKASFEEIQRQHHIEPDGIRFQ
ncbi:MAG: FKBP-type peptidyl-prolyl cis-trans isomerase SlyD [Marivirga sp.]|jgi:FKBP-type peptidyl-prolyl cis-trans isomerase SlyD